ncbi:lipopolysaccharide biosynthesis protein [Sphingobacterium sp. MYb388]|uniref:lipopolysaccharide biosynthesis protein n=1 Tax=Sphingobacterium sp. MYb388 TaxID=2745437 RepID=UPI0030A31200
MTTLKNNQDDEMSLKELFLQVQYYCLIVLKKWWLITIVGGLGFGIAYYFESKKPILYTATTTFVLETGNAGARSNVSNLSSMFGLDVGGTTNDLFQGESLLELYRSNSIIKEVLLSQLVQDSSTLLIQKLFMINEELKEEITADDQLLIANSHFLLHPESEEMRQRDSILNNAAKVVRNNYFKVFYPNAKANIIRVDVNAEDEAFAKSFNTYLVSKVNDLYMEIKAGKSYLNIKTLQFKVDSVRAVVNSAISSSAVSIDMTPNLNPTRGALRVIPTQEAQMKVETNKSLLAELNRNLEMTKLSLSKETPLIKVIDESFYPLDKTYPKEIRQGIIGCIAGVMITMVLILCFSFYQKVMKEE